MHQIVDPRREGFVLHETPATEDKILDSTERDELAVEFEPPDRVVKSLHGCRVHPAAGGSGWKQVGVFRLFLQTG